MSGLIQVIPDVTGRLLKEQAIVLQPEELTHQNTTAQITFAA
jgi:hypothetical protein